MLAGKPGFPLRDREGDQRRSLNLGKDFDAAILAIAIDDFRKACPEAALSKNGAGSTLGAQWVAMCANVRTVATQSAHVQGFDKRMAYFCISEKDTKGEKGEPKPLLPDGRLSNKDKDPQPLGSITDILLATKSEERADGLRLLEMDCPYTTIDGWKAFDKIDVQLAFGPFSITPLRWRQTDFDSAEYRRSFARSVVRNAFEQFSSIQACPSVER
jgi:hypothetical protein